MSYRIAILVPLLLAALVLAQDPPATSPASKTAKTVTPAGYVRFEVNGRSLICLPDDRTWVEAAAARVRPGVGPATRPADLFANLTAKRDLVVESLLKDLPTVNPSQIEKLIDDTLLPQLKQLAAVKPHIVFLVSPAEHLKRAMRDGWTDPRVRYNRVADQLDFERTVAMTGPDSDESTVAAIFEPSDAIDQRTTLLAQYLVTTEQQVLDQLAARGTTAVVVGLANFIADAGMKDLPRNEDQIWMKVGLSHALAARYVSMIHGSPPAEFIEAMVIGAGATTVSAASINLLNPVPLSSIRDEFVPAHVDARRRKAIAVMYTWLINAGDAKLVPTLEAAARARPADGATLVKIIKDTSGIDLTAALEPK
jgi:hypothetical protein